jgi:hypothetical protein
MLKILFRTAPNLQGRRAWKKKAPLTGGAFEFTIGTIFAD